MPPRLHKPKVLEQVQCYFYHIILVKAKHKASPHSDRQRDRFSLLLEDAACYMQRSMDAERCDSLEVSLQSVANTQNILCKKKNPLRKTKESSSRDMMLWRSSI